MNTAASAPAVAPGPLPWPCGRRAGHQRLRLRLSDRSPVGPPRNCDAAVPSTRRLSTLSLSVAMAACRLMADSVGFRGKGRRSSGGHRSSCDRPTLKELRSRLLSPRWFGTAQLYRLRLPHPLSVPAAELLCLRRLFFHNFYNTATVCFNSLRAVLATLPLARSVPVAV